MRAIVPSQRHNVRPYAWGEILVNPDPPRAGEATRIEFPLTNPGPGEVVVERIDVSIMDFGIGVRNEQLAPIGPIVLPPAPGCVETVAFTWTPERAGHRCVRAHVNVRGAETLYMGRNLNVIQANALDEVWRVPFRLGNPARKPEPIVIQVGGEGALVEADARVLVEARSVRGPIWLGPGEEVDAILELRAPSGPGLEAVRTVEAYLRGELIDGIQVTLTRPALVGARGHRLDSSGSLVAQPGADLVLAG